MLNFKDHFSKQADIYLKYRPHYPQELFAFLAGLTKNHSFAWDCGTGNGQAAIGLADYYEQVIATDPSQQQINNCLAKDNISYRVENAEQSSIQSGAADLIMVANAIHWFDFNLFYKEVSRVLKKDGVIAVCAYGLPTVTPEIDLLIKHLHDVVLSDYWIAENRLVENEYRDIPFPFELIKSPQFYSHKKMNLLDLKGYLSTWSAIQRFIDKNNFNPIEELNESLIKVWGIPDNQLPVRWKLLLKVGKIKI